MSEKIHGPNHSEKLAPVDTSELSRSIAEKHRQSSEKMGHTAEQIDELRKNIEAAATTSEAAARASEHTSDGQGTTTHHWWTPEFKLTSYRQSLSRVRKQLNTPEKVLSKTIHQPVIEKMSEIGSQTVARPSGILVGAILSFSLSLIAYVITKRDGYELRNSIFGITFVGGFIIGIILEFLVRSLRSIFSRD